jgi:hypothetical protein
MGLDMYIYEQQYVSKTSWNTEEENRKYDAIAAALGITDGATGEMSFPSVTVRVKVGYFRKFNALHRWIVENVADGVDECQSIPLHPDTLKECLSTLEEVQADPDKEADLLPPGYGFFFGEDRIYRDDLDRAVELFRRLVESENDIIYEASW